MANKNSSSLLISFLRAVLFADLWPQIQADKGFFWVYREDHTSFLIP